MSFARMLYSIIKNDTTIEQAVVAAGAALADPKRPYQTAWDATFSVGELPCHDLFLIC